MSAYFSTQHFKKRIRHGRCIEILEEFCSAKVGVDIYDMEHVADADLEEVKRDLPVEDNLESGFLVINSSAWVALLLYRLSISIVSDKSD